MEIDLPNLPCPECGYELYAEIVEWETDTGIPTEGGVYVHCKSEDALLATAEADDSCDIEYLKTLLHRHYQSEWQPIIDQATQYCQENVRKN